MPAKESGPTDLRVGRILAGVLLFAVACVVVYVGVGFYRHVHLTGLCKNRLKMVQLAIEEYSGSHGGYLPPSLDALLTDRYFLYVDTPSKELLTCPRTGEQYIYFYEGTTAKLHDLDVTEILISERGFPHKGLSGGLKYTMTVVGAFVSIGEDKTLRKIEENPAELQRLLRSVLEDGEEKVAD